jgi:hypothetical protein
MQLQPFVTCFQTDWKSQINLQNPLSTAGEVVTAFVELLDRFWDPESVLIAPREFKATAAAHAEQFANAIRHDSHEFLSRVLDFVHEDLNRILDKPIVDEVYGDGTNDPETAERFWSGYVSRNDSLVIDLFHGLYRSRLVCPNCGQVSVVFDPYRSVSLPLPIPAYTTPQFVFVPWDLAEPRVLMDLVILNDFSVLDIVENLSDQFRRKMTVAFAERPKSSSDLRWKTQVVKGYQENTLIAFEIPERPATSVFVPVRIASLSGTRLEELDSFFLVELPDEHGTTSPMRPTNEAETVEAVPLRHCHDCRARRSVRGGVIHEIIKISLLDFVFWDLARR